jgi:hypothetical protein
MPYAEIPSVVQGGPRYSSYISVDARVTEDRIFPIGAETRVLCCIRPMVRSGMRRRDGVVS